MDEQTRLENLQVMWYSAQALDGVRHTQQLVAKLDEAQRAHLFRFHSPVKVTGTEHRQRFEMDITLGSYGLFPVGTICGFLPQLYRSADLRLARDTLGAPGVAPYFERHYPYLPAHLLLQSLRRQVELPVDQHADAQIAFDWLVRFSTRFTHDRELSIFLWLLDSGSYGAPGEPDYLSIVTLKSLLHRPEIAVQAFQPPQAELSRQDRAILGTFRFLTFCREFDAALTQLDHIPLAQSALWHYYAHWLVGLQEDVPAHARECLDSIDKWTRHSETSADCRDEAEQAHIETTSALERLTSRRYQPPLLDALERLNSSWILRKLFEYNRPKEPFRTAPPEPPPCAPEP